MVAYCLQCLTQKCDLIAELLEKNGAVRAFSPKVVSRQRKQGKNEERAYDMLPGYVFLYMEKPIEDHSVSQGVGGIVRWLGKESGMGELTGTDLEFAMNLYQKDGVIGRTTIFKEGENVRVKDPLFENYHGAVVQIDHRKERAKIRFFFDGQERFIWLACDILYRDTPKSDCRCI